MSPWTCRKCNTEHDTPEQRERRARNERRTSIVAWVIILTLLGGFAGVAALWNQYIYGDWKCAFAHCRKVVP